MMVITDQHLLMKDDMFDLVGVDVQDWSMSESSMTS